MLRLFMRMLFRIAAVVALWWLCRSVAWAQGTGTVRGHVTDSLGNPVELVAVTVQEYPRFATVTDRSGYYELRVPAREKITLVFSSNLTIITERRNITLQPGETTTLNITVTLKVNEKGVVEILGERKEQIGSQVEIKTQLYITSPNESFENNIQFQGLGVVKNNDLSSNYSVRGGNFDENLVYVNDFEVYRPFLIRSGQQEGLSFVNPLMVSNVKFSSGGFQARYGDKMSSVLDVNYKKPRHFAGSFYGSLLGFGGHVEGVVKDKKRSDRFTFLLGVRQRLSQYILRSLDVQGQYNPNFLDVQGYFTLALTDKVGIELMSNYAANRYNFVPVSRETTFGILTDVKKLTVFFDGREADRYLSLMNGLSLVYTPTRDIRLKFLASYYLNREYEAYDLLGEYYLSQVESDIGKSNFGDVLYSLGIGGLHDWARNLLSTDVYYAGHRGSWFIKGHQLLWGIDYKREHIRDKLNEWNRLDSAGHSLPYEYVIDYNQPVLVDTNLYYMTEKNNIGVQGVLKSSFQLQSNRLSAFVQDSWRFGDTGQFSLSYGIRFGYWDANREPYITPRVQFSFKPRGKKDILLTVAAGTYYQPPFYREMRNLQGIVNTRVRAQKSFHGVLGFNYGFFAWKRPFQFTAETYFKYLWDLVPFEFDNVLIRYFGENRSRGFATGVDFRLNGELAEGLESWITLSVMGTAEDLIGDRYTAYYDSSGKAIANVPRNAPRIVDSAIIYPGFIPRPTDQRVNFSMYFQDYIPKFPFIKVNIGLIFGTGLPFGPPDSDRYKDVLRIPPYRRVDIGFSGQLWNPKWAKRPNRFNQGLKGVWLWLDVYNIFGITNTVSYLWINDIYNNRYAVPNYLTNRRINAKLVVNF
ncbi:MAG: carboxypeptidase regulatory-like domain-containing protein [Chitinophagales bacterium]|nr:carboxypeptidase regulatory-like domain-containing protein [Chitinophagales bacterium]MDW8418929.1 carboxypeptidase regulatory-like domain-containing protein [Chitinophagales bacterium]